jgi:hypothetical protein
MTPAKFEALRHYRRQRAITMIEFLSDYNRVISIKRNLGRISRGVYSDTLVKATHNHFIILFNCFGQYAETIIRQYISEDHYILAYAFIEICNYNVSGYEFDTTIIELLTNE